MEEAFRVPSTALTSAVSSDIYTVTRLNREARELLENVFPVVWVEGELSNLSRPTSGHWYFTLKDAGAQVRCAMFRGRNSGLGFVPAEGMQVLVRSRVSLYEARGDYQLIVEHLEEAGAGALRRAFDLLKQRLAGEGLFAAEHKRPIPALPRRIGVITSPTGAALRDILSVLGRRFPALPVLLYPVPVQGPGAAQRIAEAVHLASRRRDCDVLILARGGGSLEDLWAFNEEVVARAVYQCEIPIVTGIGHETDFTIADFAADLRAPTPSGAAERVSPDQVAWRSRLESLGARLATLLARQLVHQEERLRWLTRRLQHPGRRLERVAQRIDELEQRLQRAQMELIGRRRARLAELTAHLHRHSPAQSVNQLESYRRNLTLRLNSTQQGMLDRSGHRLASVTRALDAVSPLATLDRGYAIVTRAADAVVVRRATDVAPGATIEARLAKGRLLCEVQQTVEQDPSERAKTSARAARSRAPRGDARNRKE